MLTKIMGSLMLFAIAVMAAASSHADKAIVFAILIVGSAIMAGWAADEWRRRFQ